MNIQSFTALARGMLTILASIMLTGFAAAQNIDHYANLPGAESAAISPNGKKIAMVQGAGGDNRMVAFYPLDGSTPSRVDLGPMKVRDLTWVNNDNVILWVSLTSDYYGNSGYLVEFWRAISISESTGKIAKLFSKEPKFSLLTAPPTLLHTLPGDPEHVLMSYYDPFSGRGTSGIGSRLGNNVIGDEWALTVYEVEVETGKVDSVEAGDEHTSYFVADAEGNLRIRSDYRDKYDMSAIYYRAPDERAWTKIDEFAREDGEESDYVVSRIDRGGEHAYAFARGPGGRYRLHKYEFSGELGPVIGSNPAYDITSMDVDPHTSTAQGYYYTADLPQQEFFDPELKSLHSALKGALKPYDSVIIEYNSLDRNIFIVRARKMGSPSELYLFDRAKKELSFLASNYPNIAPEMLARVERFDYRASDGLDIPGYFYTPPGKTKKKLPLVVLPHGGPWARDTAGFHWQAQYYAAMGYAVYKPNFRGSDGFGIAFREAGYGEWGGKMQDDITEGVQKLIADGVVDPARICIVGGSYGGYASLMGGAKTPDLYKCVIAYAPVTDIPAIFRYDETYGGKSSENVVFMRKSIGNIRHDRDFLNAISPVNRASDFSAPVLLIHGKDDTVVPIDQSRDMEKALSGAGKDVTFIELEGEDHWLSTASTRKAMLEASSAFLIEHLGK